MTASELAEHASYLADPVKLHAYEQALSSVLAPGGRTVLDLGAGTGLLGLLAARAGAERVYAVDSGPVIGPAAQAARDSGLADRVTHLRARSTELTLAEPVDVAVCDQIGGFVHDAGILGYFADVRRRLLGPSGVLVPSSFRLFLGPAECTTIREQIDLWRSNPAGLDFSAFGAAAVDTEHTIGGEECRLLSGDTQVAAIQSDHDTRITGAGTAAITSAGRLDGLVGWFEADMGGGATLTNRPGDPGRMRRWCTFYPVSEALEVAPGDIVTIEVDVRPPLHAVTWRVRVATADGTQRVDERHSTLLGQFLAADDLDRSRGLAVGVTTVGRLAARALELADGTRSTDEIVSSLEAEGHLAIGSALEHTARDVLERYTRPA